MAGNGASQFVCSTAGAPLTLHHGLYQAGFARPRYRAALQTLEHCGIEIACDGTEIAL
jgi:hypothetical protein